MHRDGPDPNGMPMPRERFQELVERRQAGARPDPLLPVPAREPATVTSDLAAVLLAEAASRPLESGELLLVSEEAALVDLETAAARVSLAPAAPGLPADDPVVAELVEPRLLNPRIWEAFAWRPGLAEYLRRLEAVVRAGIVLPQTMLIGHLETFPERVEHLARLRQLATAGGHLSGGVVLSILQAGPAQLADLGQDQDAGTRGRIEAILAGAKPSGADVDRRHALAIARLALGPGAVT
jgi:hypothetical protein